MKKLFFLITLLITAMGFSQEVTVSINADYVLLQEEGKEPAKQLRTATYAKTLANGNLVVRVSGNDNPFGLSFDHKTNGIPYTDFRNNGSSFNSAVDVQNWFNSNTSGSEGGNGGGGITQTLTLSNGQLILSGGGGTVTLPSGSGVVDEIEIKRTIENDNATVALYVDSGNGDDLMGNGSVSNPWATIEKAKLHQRSNASKGTYIYVRGEHGPQVFDNALDGNLTVRFLAGAKITGAITVDYSDITVPSTAILNRIDAGVRANVREIDLATVGTSIAEIGDLFYFSSHGPRSSYGTEQGYLSIDGTKMKYSRYPETGFLKTGAVSAIGGVADVTPDDSQGGSFAYSDAEIDSWADYSSVWAFGLWKELYAFDKVGVESVSGGEITLEKGTWYGIAANRDYYLYNIVERILNEGDYAVDVENEKIYFIPPSGFDANSQIRLATSSDNLVHVDGADGIRFFGLNAELTRNTGIYVENASNVWIDQFNVSKISGSGIEIDGGEYDNWISNGVIEDIADAAFNIDGGDRLTQEYGNIKAVNVLAQRYGVRNDIRGVGNGIWNVTHKDIELGALIINGNDIMIKNTEAFNTNQIGEDDGAYYSGRNPTETGLVFDGGVMSNIGSDQEGTGIQGIYFDDRGSNGTVKNFIFHDVGAGIGSAAIKINQGKYFEIENNIVVDSDRLAWIQVSNVADWSAWYETANAVAKIAGVDGTNANSPWAIAYPSAFAQLSDEVQPSTLTNRITRLGRVNTGQVQYGIVGSSYANPSAYEEDIYPSLSYDPFVDSDAGDFRISENRHKQLWPNLNYIDASKFGYQENKVFTYDEINGLLVSNDSPNGLMAYKNKVSDSDVISVSKNKVENLERDMYILKQEIGTRFGVTETHLYRDFYTTFDGTTIDPNFTITESVTQSVTATQNDALIIANDGSGDGGSVSLFQDDVYSDIIDVRFKVTVTGANLPEHMTGIKGSTKAAFRSNSDGKIRVWVEGSVISTLTETYTSHPYQRIKVNGTAIEFYLSTDGVSWGEPVYEHTYDIGTTSMQFFTTLSNSNSGNQKTITLDDFEIYEGSTLDDVDTTTIDRYVPVFPSGTTAQRPASPEMNRLYIDEDLDKLIRYNGTEWVDMLGNSL